MSFDIPRLHLADDSPEARVVEQIVKRDKVSPAEAVLTALREIANPIGTTKHLVPKSGRSASEEDSVFSKLEMLYPGLAQLDGITDEQWAGVLKGARKLGRDRFRPRA